MDHISEIDDEESSRNIPPLYPLQDEIPMFDYKLVNPGQRLSEVWLQKEYQNISHSSPTRSSRENRKRIRNGEDQTTDDERDSTESMDDMAMSDTDTNSQISVQSAMVSGVSSSRENGIVHPPKRRLTSVISPSISEEHRQEHIVSHQKIPATLNSPTNTPISDIEESATQLPLPSPSASPVQAGQNKIIFDPIENQLSHIPSTQSELLEMMLNLSGYLAIKNQNHLIFRLLQTANRSTLSSLGGLIQNSLKRDLLSNLPLELSLKIISHLDYKTLLSLSSVCKKWFKLVNNKAIWVNLLKRDKLMMNDSDIEQELKSESLVHEWGINKEVTNVAQILYKKRCTIINRWMNPSYLPKRISVPGYGTNVVTCLQQDDEKIITGVDDKLINIYSTKTGELLKVLKGHEGGVWALKYIGNTLVSGSTDRTVRVWNIKTGKCVHVFRGHTSTVRCLDILEPVKIGVNDNGDDIVFPEVPLLVTGSRDNNLHVWKLPILDDDTEVATYDSADDESPFLVTVLLGHTGSVRSVSGYGNIIVSGSYDTTIRVWDLLNNGECRHVLTGHSDRIYSTALDLKAGRCYSGSMDSTINVYDIEKGKLLHTLQGHGSLVGLLELSNDYLVSAAADSTLRVWNPNSGENYSKLEGHGGAITCFQHDCLRIVSGSERMLKLWNINTGKFVRDLLGDITGAVWQVRFDYNRCVVAVQRGNEETFIEVLDFSEPLNKKIAEIKN